MKYLGYFLGAVVGLGFIVYVIDIWYRVFIVGRYYESANVFNNLIVGGLPVWVLMIIAGAVLFIRKEMRRK